MSALDRIIPGSRGPRTTALGIEDVFDVLSNARRRQVIQYVAGLSEGAQVDTRELSEIIAVHECGATFDAEDRRRAHIALLQCHLATLEDAGVLIPVRDGVFTKGPEADALDRVLAQVSEVSEG